MARHGCGRTRFCFPPSVVLATMALLAASSVPAGATPQQTPAFPSGVDLVRVDAVVLDPDGRPVKGLTAADFEVLEDGERREVASFETIDVRPPVGADPDASATPEAESAPHVLVPEEGRALLVYFDDTHVQEENASRVRSALAPFLARELRPGDAVTFVAPRAGTVVDRSHPVGARPASVGGRATAGAVRPRPVRRSPLGLGGHAAHRVRERARAERLRRRPWIRLAHHRRQLPQREGARALRSRAVAHPALAQRPAACGGVAGRLPRPQVRGRLLGRLHPLAGAAGLRPRHRPLPARQRRPVRGGPARTAGGLRPLRRRVDGAGHGHRPARHAVRRRERRLDPHRARHGRRRLREQRDQRGPGPRARGVDGLLPHRLRAGRGTGGRAQAPGARARPGPARARPNPLLRRQPAGHPGRRGGRPSGSRAVRPCRGADPRARPSPAKRRTPSTYCSPSSRCGRRGSAR